MGCVVGGARVESRNVIWTAGVTPSPAAAWLGLPPGKVRVRYDLSAPSLPEVFVIGDVAYYEQGGRPLPGVAQVAMQMGRHVARVIQARLHNNAPPPPFHYTDKGNMAVVGRNFAIFERGKTQLQRTPRLAHVVHDPHSLSGSPQYAPHGLLAVDLVLLHRAARLPPHC